MRLIDYGFMVSVANGEREYSLANGYPEQSHRLIELKYHGDRFAIITELNDSFMIAAMKDKSTVHNKTYVDKNKMYHRNGRTQTILKHLMAVMPKETDDQRVLFEALKSFLKEYLDIEEMKKRDEAEV